MNLSDMKKEVLKLKDEFRNTDIKDWRKRDDILMEIEHLEYEIQGVEMFCNGDF
jgi:hypothetical protein